MRPVILLIDDDELFLDEVGQLLRSCEYETVVVRDPLIAVATALKTRPSVILMDLSMPGRNGFEVAFDLKDVPGLVDIPVIAMSGLSDQENSVYLELSKIQKFLTKPFNPLDLIWSIEEILNKGSIALVPGGQKVVA